MIRKKLACSLTVITFTVTSLIGCGNTTNSDVSSSTTIEDNSTETVPTSESPATDNSDILETATAEAESSDTKEISLGMSGYTIEIPSHYYEGEVRDNERADDMIAYYKSDISDMDFDVYEFPRKNQDLHIYAKVEAVQYNSDEVQDITINDIPMALYYSEEEYDGENYRVANYLFTNPDEFVELSFWLDGDDAEAQVEKIINSIKK